MCISGQHEELPSVCPVDKYVCKHKGNALAEAETPRLEVQTPEYHLVFVIIVNFL